MTRTTHDATPRKGEYTGKTLVDAQVSGENYKAEKYVGIGPLVVKTARGEIKAISGDIIVYFDDPTDKEKPVYLHVIPSEIADYLGIELPEPPEELAPDQGLPAPPEARMGASKTPPAPASSVRKQ